MAQRRTAAALALVAEVEVATVRPGLPAPTGSPMTSSARPLPPNKNFTPQYTEAQVSAWDMWRGVPESYAAVRWLANAMSRVRLVIATTTDDGTEPQRLETGPAVDILNRLAGGAGGQTQLMSEFATHYSVPGVCWLVGEAPDETNPYGPDTERWSVLSANELRIADSARSRKQYGERTTYEIREWEGRDGQNSNRPGTPPTWRPISPDSLVVKCWRQDPQMGWLADSPTIHSLPALVELDLVNKRILAEVMSRLASNGVLLYDAKRLSIPGRTPGQGADVNAPDAFGTMLVDVASNGIANPASPEACLPIPIGHNIDDLTDIDPKNLLQLIEFPSEIQEKLLTLRTSAISRVATGYDLPDEYLTQTRGSVNHWGLASIEKSAIQGPIASTAELICNSLSLGFLVPMMKAAGLSTLNADGSRTIIWYDPSELEVKPDNTDDVVKAYDRGEITGDTLRRRVGVDEDAAPSDDERQRIILTKQAMEGSIVALQILAGIVPLADAAQTADPGVRPVADPAAPGPVPPTDVPSTDPDSQAPSNDTVTASAAKVVRIEYHRSADVVKSPGTTESPPTDGHSDAY